MLTFICGERKIPSEEKVSKYFDHDLLQNIFLLFMSLLTALIVKKGYNFAAFYFIFVKKRPRSNLNIFQ